MKNKPPLFAFVVAAAFVALRLDAQQPPPSDLPPPEATEYWTPVPPIVTAAPGQPPSDAIVLFAGSSLAEWEPAKAKGKMWRLEDGAMVVDSTKYSPEEAERIAATPGRKPDSPWDGLRTKRAFGDVQLHLEFRCPAVVVGKSQGRGNSGVFFMEYYEVQVLDSYDNPTYVNGQAGSVYKQFPPLVNASRPPGEWQTYDIVFIAPRFDDAGRLVSPARITAFHNGVLIQHDVHLTGPTLWRGQPKYKAHAAKLPLILQDHNNLTAFRNIWIRELATP